MKNLVPVEGSTNAKLTRTERTPHVITAAVTYDCQCDCQHCSAVHSQEAVRKAGNALTTDELKSAIGQSVDLGVTCVVLTGGEPLLFKGIYDVIASVDRRRSVCTMFTNGEFLDQPTIDKLKAAGLFGLYVSFDYSDPALHDKNRDRPGLFDKAVKGLALARKSGLLTGISTYATREKIQSGELDAMMELARKLDVLEVFLFDVIPTGRLRDQHECILSDGEVQQIRAFRAEYNEKPEYPRIIHQTMFASIAYPCVAEGCPAGMVQMHLRANGDVAPCDFTPYSFGNIRNQPLAEIWQAMSEDEMYAESSPRCRLSQPDYWTSLEKLEATV